VLGDVDSGGQRDEAGAPGRDRRFRPGTADERITDLQSVVIEIERSIGETQETARAGAEALRTEMTGEIRRLDEKIEAAEADRQAERQRGFVADARVIPVVVLGVVLTAIPDELAEVPVLGCLVAVAAMISALVVAAYVVRDARRT
jgi:hypothetical protein